MALISKKFVENVEKSFSMLFGDNFFEFVRSGIRKRSFEKFSTRTDKDSNKNSNKDQQESNNNPTIIQISLKKASDTPFCTANF